MKFIGWSNYILSFLFSFVAPFYFFSCKEKPVAKIDRLALVTRHNVILQEPDTLGSLSIGNGEFAFTVDASGLQTFPDEYENGIPLGTQSQWAWHRMPSEQFYTVKDVAAQYESCDGTKVPYATQQSQGRAGEATNFLRANPHRLHLGLIGLILLKENGEEIRLNELTSIDQRLDLWTGKIESKYEVEGNPVSVILYAHQQEDRIAARIESALVGEKRLKIKLRFPYGKDCHVCPGYDWGNSDKHYSNIVLSEDNRVIIKHALDTTTYYTQINWNGAGIFNKPQRPHQFILNPSPETNVFEFSVAFSPDSVFTKSDFKSTEQNSIQQWKEFWITGGVVDFSECTDARAKELERRVILSQYLTKIQCSGSLPPQETGLTMNSWFGKFHLEMYWWHAAHFALWGRASLMEKSLSWYARIIDKAKATAKWQGYLGARWPKMTDPYGNESPSNIGAFIIWQQPHPIYLAELLYRNDSSDKTLQSYKDIVFNTADFMASFVKFQNGTYHLCHPLIPAQEIFISTETEDTAYELQYWYHALTIAQEWRKRLGMAEHEKWRSVIENLAPLAVKDNLYLPTTSTPDAYRDDQYRRDHPAVVGAYGFLPFNSRMDTSIMANTFSNIMSQWKWETTWGWDYPLLAMTAARLNKPEAAVEALLMDVQKNTYLINGHNYQDKRLRLYLPGNGGLLSAVAMMTAGWDGSNQFTPGFPQNGKWNVKWEGLKVMP